LGVFFTEKKPYVTYGGVAQGWAYTSGYLGGKIAAENALAGR
jgi:fumarate reductase flavoprotein subunit